MRVEIRKRIEEWSYPLIVGDVLDVSQEIGSMWCSDGRAVEVHGPPVYRRRVSDRWNLT